MMNWKYLLTGVLAGSTLVLRAAGEAKDERPNILFLKSASNLNGNLNCSKELEHYAS